MHITIGHVVVVLIVFVLAVMRLTRLINADRITDFIRVYLAGQVRLYTVDASEAIAHGQTARHDTAIKKQQRWSTAFEFVQCPWCVGWWVALAGAPVPVWWIGWPWWVTFPLALAVSQLVGMLARFSDTEEIEIEEAE